MNSNFNSKKTNRNSLKRILMFGFFAAIIICSVNTTFAQNVGINGTGAAPDNAAMLDISSSTKALLPPRVILTATNVFAPVAPSTSSVTAGFIVYNTTAGGSAPNNVVPGYYYWDGAKWVLFTTQNSTGGNVMFTGFQVFTASSTFTLPTGVTKVMIEMWGGGGGGGYASAGGTGYGGSGGGGGAYNKSLFTVSSNITVTIGPGGGGGISTHVNGYNGTATTVSGGAVMSAGGGTGGTGADANGVIAAGGVATTTTSSLLGINGYPGGPNIGGASGGSGGNSPAGGAGGQCNGNPGLAGAVPGGGGGGAAQSNTLAAGNGGAGAAGMVIIWW